MLAMVRGVFVTGPCQMWLIVYGFVFKQDWIALVKAASAAAKNKGGNRPRTSANSNKDREDRREQRSDEELEDDEDDDDESESEKLGMWFVRTFLAQLISGCFTVKFLPTDLCSVIYLL